MKKLIVLFFITFLLVGCQKEDISQYGIYVNGTLICKCSSSQIGISSAETKGAEIGPAEDDNPLYNHAVVQNLYLYGTKDGFMSDSEPEAVVVIKKVKGLNHDSSVSEEDFFSGITLINIPDSNKLYMYGATLFPANCKILGWKDVTVNKCSFGKYDWLEHRGDDADIDFHVVLDDGTAVDIKYKGKMQPME